MASAAKTKKRENHALCAKLESVLKRNHCCEHRKIKEEGWPGAEEGQGYQRRDIWRNRKRERHRIWASHSSSGVLLE
jgi:hypothetical protein